MLLGRLHALPVGDGGRGQLGTVLGAEAGIEEFKFPKDETSAQFGQVLEFHQRRIADGAHDVLVPLGPERLAFP